MQHEMSLETAINRHMTNLIGKRVEFSMYTWGANEPTLFQGEICGAFQGEKDLIWQIRVDGSDCITDIKNHRLLSSTVEDEEGSLGPTRLKILKKLKI